MTDDSGEDEKVDEAVEEMKSDVEDMQERSEKLGERIEETKNAWHAKQQDDAVPGAQPPADDAEPPPRRHT